MKTKILLIQPRNLQSLNNYPPLGLVCIGSSLERAGFAVTILPTARFRNYKEIIQKEGKDCLLVGISVLTPEVPHGIEISKYIKKIYPNLPIVWGGWHATLFPEQIAKSSLVDYVVVGDGDELIVDLANKLKNNQKIKTNLLKNKIHVDIDKLPIPNYNLIMKLEEYITDDLTDKFCEYNTKKIRWLPYQSSRGCPHQCLFCINTVTNNQIFRKKSPQKVLSEIESILKKYNIDHLKIIDDNFFVDIDRVKKICDNILQKNLHFSWDVECRTDYFKKGFVDDSLLALLKKAGCVQFTLGLESGSQTSLDRMKKDSTVAQNEYAVKQLDKWGFVIRTSFIVDLPGDTKDDLLKTQKLINQLRKYKKFTAGMATYRPYPKSPLHDLLVDQGFINEPKKLLDWTNEYYVRLYGIYDTKKPWQKNYRLSTNLAFYNSVESCVWLRNYQLRRKLDKAALRLLKKLAKIRNKLLFYYFTVDRNVYTFFRDSYYKRVELVSQKDT